MPPHSEGKGFGSTQHEPCIPRPAYGTNGILKKKQLFSYGIVIGASYATDDICTHEFASLAEGFVDGDCIECPLHAGKFHIPTGKAMTAPVTEDIRTYPVKVEGDEIFINLSKA